MATETLGRQQVKAPAGALTTRQARRMIFTSYLYILPAALIMGIITLWPLIYQFWMSFTNYSNLNLRTDSLFAQMVGTFTGDLETHNSPALVGAGNYISILFGNLAAVLSGFDFWRILLFNLVWTFVNLIFHVSIGVLVAMLLNQSGMWFKGLYRSLFVIPWAMPALVSAMIWRNMFDDQSGGMNLLARTFGQAGNTRWLQQIEAVAPWLPPYVRATDGMDPFLIMFVMFLALIIPFFFRWVRERWWQFLLAWLVVLELIFLVVVPLFGSGPAQSYGFGQLFPLSFYAVLIANIWLGWPFMMAVATGALQSIPADLYEAAAVDGATWWDKFWMVTVPLLRPAMIPAIIIGMTMTFNQFNVIYFISGGGPLHQTEILVTQAYRLVNETTVNIPGVGSARPYGVASAFAYIVFVVLAIITLITNRVSRATEAYNE